MLVHDPPAAGIAAQDCRAPSAAADLLAVDDALPRETEHASRKVHVLGQPDLVVCRVGVVLDGVEIGLDRGADRILSEMRRAVAVEKDGVVAQNGDAQFSLGGDRSFLFVN